MFRLTVDDVFWISGRGSVATGHVEEGAIRVGDEVRINGGDPVKVDGVEAFRKLIDRAQAGEDVGLLFRTIGRGDIAPGDVITAASDSLAATPAPEAPPEVPAAEVPPAPAAPREMPAAAEPAAAGTGPDPRFAETAAQRTQLLSMRDAGIMTEGQIDDALRDLTFTYAGRQWRLTAASDSWYSSEGGDWRRDTPPS